MIDQLNEVIAGIEHTWATKRLLVIGDVMLDQYIWGAVDRISPEAPVPVVRTTHRTDQPGGAANVAMNLAKLGAQTILVGFTGADENEALLATKLQSNGISSVLIHCDGYPTTTKLRILGGRQQMLRLDTERVAEHGQVDYERLMEAIRKILPTCDAVVLSDYAKGVLTFEVCQQVIQLARKVKIPVLVDPKVRDFSRYRGATTICPNRSELALAVNMDSRDLKVLLAKAESMVQTLELNFLTVTLSENGIALVRPDSCLVEPALAHQVFDVSGAGDAVIAVLALGLTSGLSPEVSMKLANLAAGIVVSKVGTVPVEKHELLAALTSEIALHAADKVVARAELVSRVALWRVNGERVVFTNGCFDLLHIGHITVLERARSFGDKLIVGINSDASVRALKGEKRPIVGEKERARVLAALAAVDAVVIFDEPTPLELIMAVRPEVIVKGGDYDPESIVGAPEVESWGGKVKIVPLVDDYSTTRLINKGASVKPGGSLDSLSNS